MATEMFMLSEIYSKKRLAAIAAVLLILAVAGFLVYFLKDTGDKKSNFSFAPSMQAPLADPAGNSYPAQTLDLSNWKLNLPIANPDDPELPLDINQPELATYQRSPWFRLSPDKKGVIFRAPVNAPTTANSSYPRSELREMTTTDEGVEEAVWPSTKGTHTLFLDQAITAVPKNKPDVVAGQIHGDDDDLIVIRLEDKKLFVARSRANLATLDENYTLGKRFTIKFVAKGGEISVYYNGSVAPAYTLEKKVKEAYFKAGVYTQSNCETEGSPELCSDDNYGEVVIYQAVVTHE